MAKRADIFVMTADRLVAKGEWVGGVLLKLSFENV